MRRMLAQRKIVRSSDSWRASLRRAPCAREIRPLRELLIGYSGPPGSVETVPSNPDAATGALVGSLSSYGEVEEKSHILTEPADRHRLVLRCGRNVAWV